MANKIDDLIKKLPKNHSLSVNSDDNGVSVNLQANDTSGNKEYAVTVRVDGDAAKAYDAVVLAAEIAKERKS